MILGWTELLLSAAALAITVWSFSGFCTGRPLGFDCESWMIFAVNAFGPFGVIALVCAAWTLKTGSMVPQYCLALGSLAIFLWWALHFVFA